MVRGIGVFGLRRKALKKGWFPGILRQMPGFFRRGLAHFQRARRFPENPENEPLFALFTPYWGGNIIDFRELGAIYEKCFFDLFRVD